MCVGAIVVKYLEPSSFHTMNVRRILSTNNNHLALTKPNNHLLPVSTSLHTRKKQSHHYSKWTLRRLISRPHVPTPSPQLHQSVPHHHQQQSPAVVAQAPSSHRCRKRRGPTTPESKPAAKVFMSNDLHQACSAKCGTRQSSSVRSITRQLCC